MYYIDTYYSYKRIKRGMLKVGCFANPSSVTRCTLKLPNVKRQSVEIITMPLCYKTLYIAELLLFAKHHYCNISMWCHQKEIVAVDVRRYPTDFTKGVLALQALTHKATPTSSNRLSMVRTRAFATWEPYLLFLHLKSLLFSTRLLQCVSFSWVDHSLLPQYEERVCSADQNWEMLRTKSIYIYSIF